ncbi:hypothetical protein HPB51_026308 [Rhipicephalus microplus]|uniref:Carboxylesterase type B domain-containing protein n=1 Tax=Rhipicephalus microplus TaxID=6941 RepID=A0A9J6D3F2_RHIMP|nr:hypothetical protein HPB51_026308 [Rhipicephalus microplus]
MIWDSMQEDLPTSCDLSPLYEPSEHMTPFCSAHDGASAASREAEHFGLQAFDGGAHSAQPSGSAAHWTAPHLCPKALPLCQVVFGDGCPLVDDAVRKPLIGDSSCLSYDFECSCSIPESRATNKAPPQPAAPSGTNSHACKLAVFIGCLILLSLVISQFLVTRQGNYAFSLTSKFGHVQGDQIFVHGGQPVIRYLGIPFAVPPVGKLRFQPSQVAEHLGGKNL